IEVISESHDYPITPKNHGTEFLMDHRHLWLRSKRQHAVMKIRNEIIRATYEFFNDNGFTKIDPPILTGTAPEGTSELFHTKYFDEDAFLSKYLVWNNSLVPSGAVPVNIGGSIFVNPLSLKNSYVARIISFLIFITAC